MTRRIAFISFLTWLAAACGGEPTSTEQPRDEAGLEASAETSTDSSADSAADSGDTGATPPTPDAPFDRVASDAPSDQVGSDAQATDAEDGEASGPPDAPFDSPDAGDVLLETSLVDAKRDDAGACPAHVTACNPDAGADAAVSSVEYARDVVPILAARCTTCHAENGDSGIWPLGTYQHVYDWRALMSADLVECRMPPVEASPLSVGERETLLDWLDCGALDN